MKVQDQAEDVAECMRLCTQRTWFATGAVTLIALAMAVSLPRRVQRYRLHKGLNAELLDVQAQIGGLQSNISEVEKKIIAAQAEIKILRSSAP